MKYGILAQKLIAFYETVHYSRPVPLIILKAKFYKCACNNNIISQFTKFNYTCIKY